MRILRWVRMRVGFRDLALWSFLMASAHDASLMVMPVLLGGNTVEAQGRMASHDHMSATASPLTGDTRHRRPYDCLSRSHGAGRLGGYRKLGSHFSIKHGSTSTWSGQLRSWPRILSASLYSLLVPCSSWRSRQLLPYRITEGLLVIRNFG